MSCIEAGARSLAARSTGISRKALVRKEVDAVAGIVYGM